MDVGIIGFAHSGKTTLFNALTGSEAEIGGYAGRGAEPNVAVVRVPDERVDRLVELYEAKKTVYATVTYIDVAGIEDGGGSGSVLPDSLIKAVANCDAMMAVIRGFALDGRDPQIEADIEAMGAELILTDLARVELRLERIGKAIGKLKGAERQQLEREQEVMNRCKAALEEEKPIRELEFDADEEKILRTHQLMTLKPLLLVLNLDEGSIAECERWEEKVRALGLAPGTSVTACCAQSEMEIALIDDEADRREFLETYGITEPMAGRVIRVTYATLGLISFFTAGPSEVHAWTLRKGLSAVKAAGKIHSDMERGFIRAEVIVCEELLRCGSNAQAKKEGVLRTEGKTYIIADGDVIEIRFSV